MINRTDITSDRWTLDIIQADNAIEVNTPDGVGADFVCGIQLTDRHSGDCWLYPKHFLGEWVYLTDEETGQDFDVYRTGYQSADYMVGLIREHGSVNLSRWERIK